MNSEKIMHLISNLRSPIHYGQVTECVGLVIEAECQGAFIGELCNITSAYSKGECRSISAEVVGFRQGKVLLMPYEGTKGIRQGDLVRHTGTFSQMKVGDGLLGRVIDAFGSPLDQKGEIQGLKNVSLHNDRINPLKRKPISNILETGIRAIDGFVTMGVGQRLGLLAGSGVGKSSLLSSMCKHVKADINVVALIGERGREVEDFVNKTLGEEGLSRTVVIAATAQDSPLIRVQAAYGAIACAEYFADQGHNVFFTMDSITRFATALREIGLAAGEPPTVKGYTPSVFSAIPDLIERCGNFHNRGSISAIFTVLVESDDFNDPVVDTVRAILDGHIVMSRQLAEQNHYPAIDVSKSISRLYSQLNTSEFLTCAGRLKKVFSDYQQNKDILELGLFESKNNTEREKLKNQWQELERVLVQKISDNSPADETRKQIVELSSK
jgi:flagellum-specific ATP synthase